MRTNTWIVFILSAAIALPLGAFQTDAQKDLRVEAQLQAAITLETVEGDLKGAIEQYQKIAAMAGAGRATVATALLRMGLCYEKMGNVEASKAYERVVREFADQREMVAAARARLAALGQGSGSAAGVAVHQVWADAPWYGAMGAPSRDGAFLTFRTESEDVAIRDLASGRIRQLTKHESVRQSAWTSIPSPDGKQVAYAWNQDGTWELRVVGLNGAEPRVLCNGGVGTGVRPYPADWSPDGASILTVFWDSLGYRSRIASVAVRDGSARILKDFDKRLTERPRYSPDGRSIVFDRQQRPGSDERDIFILALDGGGEIPLIEHPADDAYPDWTPDGKGVLFFSDRTGTMGAWRIPVVDGGPRGTPELLKPDVRADQHMGFTRNGSYYYGVRSETSDVFIAELDPAAGRLVSSPKAACQRFVGTNGKPEWSPDGRQLLFLSKRGMGYWGTTVLCVRSADSGEVRELISKLDRAPHARWSPDGRSLIALASHPTQGIGCFRIDIQTGDFVAIPLRPGAIGWTPEISRDGRVLIYQAALRDPNRFCVLARDIETGEEKEVYSTTARFAFSSRLALSPDGRQLAFVFNENDGNGSKSLRIIPTAGGEARDVLRGVPIPSCEIPIAWAPDGSSLLFLKQLGPTPASKTELWSISLPGGEPRKLGLDVEGMIDISIHPDGRQVAFTQVRNRDEIWAIENFLPSAKAVK